MKLLLQLDFSVEMFSAALEEAAVLYGESWIETQSSEDEACY